MAIRLAVLASGGGSNLQAMLDLYNRLGSNAAGEVALVASDRRASIALDRAKQAKITTEYVGSGTGGKDLLSVLIEHRIDLVVLAGYLKLIPREVTTKYKGRIINIHPGSLPEFGGGGMYGIRVHEAVIAAGNKATAVTIHFVDDEYDHGDVIVKWPVAVLPGDTPQTLAERVLKVEHIVYPRIVEMIATLLNSTNPAT